MKELVNDKVEDCLQFSDWVVHKNDYKRKCVIIEDLQKRVVCLEQRSKKIDDKLELKLDSSEMDSFKTLVQQLPDIEEVEKIKNFVSDNIKEFRGEHARFRYEFQNHCEIIRRYDEVLGLKASTIALQDQRNEIDENIEKKIEDALDYIEKTRSEVF